MIQAKPRGQLHLYRNRNKILYSLTFDQKNLAKMRNKGFAWGLDTTVSGSPVWGTGPDGSELIFDGTNDVLTNEGEPGTAGGSQLDIAVKDGTNFFGARLGCAIRIRFRSTSGTAVNRWWEIVSNSTGPLCIFNYPDAGKCKYYFNTLNDADALDSTGTPALNDGNMHDIWFVRYWTTSGGTQRARIYIDGKLNAQRDQNGTGPIQDGGGITIGRDSSFANFWIGRMSLFEIYNHPPTMAEVASKWADPYQDYRPPNYAAMALAAGEPVAPDQSGDAVSTAGRTHRRRLKLRR